MRNNRLWENINKISIVFVFTVMCVITGVTNVRADGARCTYYREITEDENLAISDSLLSDYVGSINSSAVKNFLGLNCDLDTSTEESCRNVLESRYEHLVGLIERHINLLVPQIS